MFITLTRIGGANTLRVAAAAIAHITTMADGAVVHLVSGEHLRVGEQALDIENTVLAALTPDNSAIADLLDELREQGAAWRTLLEARSATVSSTDADPGAVQKATAAAAVPVFLVTGDPKAATPVKGQPRRGRGRRP